MSGWWQSVVCRLTPSGAERAPVRAAQVMNGDGGDDGVGGVGNVAVRYRGARTARPMVGGWEREMLCVWRRRRGLEGLALFFCCGCRGAGVGGAYFNEQITTFYKCNITMSGVASVHLPRTSVCGPHEPRFLAVYKIYIVYRAENRSSSKYSSVV